MASEAWRKKWWKSSYLLVFVVFVFPFSLIVVCLLASCIFWSGIAHGEAILWLIWLFSGWWPIRCFPSSPSYSLHLFKSRKNQEATREDFLVLEVTCSPFKNSYI